MSYPCHTCGKDYTNNSIRWCKSCQIINIKKNFTSWTSGNEKIDDFIQEMQLNINEYDDIILEWIPYDQFINIKEINKDNFDTTCLAIWKDGPLNYDKYCKEYTRKPYKKVALKCLHNSQNNTNEFLNEV
jgi:hypothetical protein